MRYTKFIKRYLKVRQASATPDMLGEYQTMRRQFPRLVEHFQREMIILNDRSLYKEEYRHMLDIAQKDDIPLNQHEIEELRQKLSDFVTDDTSTAAMATVDRFCICLAKNSSVILSPCGHKCLCNDCVDQQQEPLTNCPICRQKILHPITPTV